MNRNRHALPNGRIKLATRGLSCLFLVGINVDTKNSKRFSDPKVREAVEYAIDKEAICSGPVKGYINRSVKLYPAIIPTVLQPARPASMILQGKKATA